MDGRNRPHRRRLQRQAPQLPRPRHPRQSPAEAYALRRTEDIIRLSAEERYLLATHRLQRPVSRNGLRLPPGLGGGLYRGENTGDLVGRDVLAWIDPDDLSKITVTDLDRQNPRIVERADAPSAFADHPDEIRQAADNLKAHNQHGANLYRVVSGAAGKQFRRVVVDQKTAATGVEMACQNARHVEQERAVATDRRVVENAANTSGVPFRPADTPDQLARQRQGLEMIHAARIEMEKQKPAAAAAGTP